MLEIVQFLQTFLVHRPVTDLAELQAEFFALEQMDRERWLRLQGVDIPVEEVDDKNFGNILENSQRRDIAPEISPPDLVSEGVIQQAVTLLPYIPNILITLGPYGVLSVRLCPKSGNTSSRSQWSRWIDVLSHSLRLPGVHGDVYLRHHRGMKSSKVVSVTGAGYARDVSC